MKLCALHVKNLNSLAGEWNINFEDPAFSSGIFLLTQSILRFPDSQRSGFFISEIPILLLLFVDYSILFKTPQAIFGSSLSIISCSIITLPEISESRVLSM